jgi:acyl carrier protein
MEEARFLELVEKTLEAKPGTIHLADSLKNMGWDSLADIIFISIMDDDFNAPVDTQRLAECSNFDQLFELVNESVI